MLGGEDLLDRFDLGGGLVLVGFALVGSVGFPEYAASRFGLNFEFGADLFESRHVVGSFVVGRRLMICSP